MGLGLPYEINGTFSSMIAGRDLFRTMLGTFVAALTVVYNTAVCF